MDRASALSNEFCTTLLVVSLLMVFDDFDNLKVVNDGDGNNDTSLEVE